MRAESEVRERVCEHRESGRLDESPERVPTESTVGGARDDEATLGVIDCSRDPIERCLVERRSPGRRLHERAVAAVGFERVVFGPIVGDARRVVRGNRGRFQWLAEATVEVDRPRVHAGRLAECSGGRSPQHAHLPWLGLRFGHVAVPPDRIAVQLLLVDGLVGTAVDEFRRAVGRQEEHRDARLIRLDDRGVEVRRRGPRGTDQRGRSPGSSRPSEREEGCGALVQMREHLHVRVLGERDGQRRRPTPR